MSAQKQLADLNVALAEHLGSSMQKAALFLRDHGPAIAELIDAVANQAANSRPMTKQMQAALRKLTQDATT